MEETLLELSRARIPDAVAVLALDTETTSLVGVVVQVGVVGLDAESREVFREEMLVAPAPGYAVQPDAQRVHGLSDADVRSRGMPPERAMRRVAEIVATARARRIPIVAHNAAFDARSLQRTAQAVGLAPDDAPVAYREMVCTMQRSRRLAKRVKGHGMFRNAELFAHLCQEAPPPESELHDAVADARLTARAYLAGERNGTWR